VAQDNLQSYRRGQAVVIPGGYTEEKSNTITPERSPLQPYYRSIDVPNILTFGIKTLYRGIPISTIQPFHKSVRKDAF